MFDGVKENNRGSEISLQFERLHSQIQGLTENVKILGNRLAPIRSTPLNVASSIVNTLTAHQRPQLCDVAERIRNLSEQVESQTNEIQQMLDTVEL